MIPDGVDVFYRYVVSMFVPPNPYEAASADDKVVVRRWETNLKPRKIACHGKNICDGNVKLRHYCHYLAMTQIYCIMINYRSLRWKIPS